MHSHDRCLFYKYEMLIDTANVTMTEEEAGKAGTALLFVAIADALILSFLILRSPWHGLKLTGIVMLIHFSTETLMSQIETLYFISAVQMGMDEFFSIVAAGAVRALIFAPLIVLIFGRMRKPLPSVDMKKSAFPSGWIKRFICLSILYFVIYFVFGYFVAWQWSETRFFYTGTTEIKPFFTHFFNLFIKEDPKIIPFQLFRGMLWSSLAMSIAWMIKGKRWEVSLASAFTFAVFLGLPLGMFPNPYMPPMVAQSHFVEATSSMLLFGGIAGWVMYRKEKADDVQESPAMGLA